LENVGYRLCESGVGHRLFDMKVLWNFDMVYFIRDILDLFLFYKASVVSIIFVFE